ncbi:hypothetical protein ACT7C5_24115 [Bacillus pacificus]
MESLQFKKWPFQEDERIKVHWFRSPYRVENKEWVLDVILQREDQVLRKGQQYLLDHYHGYV